MSVFIVRDFVQLREMLSSNAELAAKLLELEHKVSGHDQAIDDACGRKEPPNRFHGGHRGTKEMMGKWRQ